MLQELKERLDKLETELFYLETKDHFTADEFSYHTSLVYDIVALRKKIRELEQNERN